MRCRYFLLSVLVGVVAIPLPARSGAGSVPAATAEDTADAEALVRKYLETFNAPDPVALAGLYAVDGLILPPSGGPVKGREAIKSYWSASSRRDLSFNILQKTVCGEAGFFVGSYSAREARTGRYSPASPFVLLGARARQVPMAGNFTLGLRRGDDGKWQIATDMWTESYPGGFILAGQPNGFNPAARPEP